MTAFNIWQPQGLIFSGTGVGNASVIYDSNPVILGGPNVFKAWVGNHNNNTTNYYESADGITSWNAYSGNPILSGGGNILPTVYKVGSTYYLYIGDGTITCYTSSDGVAFASQGTALTKGTAGTWDDTHAGQINVVDVISGTWYGYYSGTNSTGIIQQGLITSSDGKTWTKDAGNPAIAGTAAKPAAQASFLKVGSTYYAWVTSYPPNATLQALGQTALYRYSASSPSGPWTELTYNGNPINVFYPSIAADFSGATTGMQVGDSRLCVALGNIYLYYTKSSNFGQEVGTAVALASGVTPAQLVAGYEGVRNAPFSGATALNLATVATDTFQRADANPIGGNWTPLHTGSGGFSTAQLASHLVEPSDTTNAGDSWYTGTWANDQWSKITYQTSTGAYAGADVRMNKAGAITAYRSYWHAAGALGTAGVLTLATENAGVSAIIVNITWTMSNGDTVTLVPVGSNIMLYWNDYLISASTSSLIAAGNPGFIVQGNPVTAAQLSAWSGGIFAYAVNGNAGVGGATVSYSGTTSSGSVTANASGDYTIYGLAADSYTITPTMTGQVFSPVSSSQTVSTSDIAGVNFTATATASNYSVPDCRVAPYGPNSSRTVNGTKIYDVQTSSNAAVPSTDSRAAGAPVDSRVSPNIPQNSRAPGTFGPNE